MAKEVISKILEIEKENAENLSNAKLNAAQMIKDAKISAERNYQEEVSKAKDLYEKTILDAKTDSDAVIKKAEEDGLKDKESMIKDLNSRQEKAISEIIDSLV